MRNTYDDHEYDDHHHKSKISVMTKVKEKARRWKQSLGKKKHPQGGNATPAWGVSLDEEDEDWAEQDPVYHGAPMYQSKMASNEHRKVGERQKTAVNKEMIIDKREGSLQQPIGAVNKEMIMDKWEGSLQQPMKVAAVMPDGSIRTPESVPDGESRPENNPVSIMWLANAVTGILLAPVYVVSGATQMIASKIQGSPGGGGKEEAIGTVNNPFSVKQYLMHKLEPGEDERALSDVITEAISPRKAALRQGGESGPSEKLNWTTTAPLSSLGEEERASSEGATKEIASPKKDASASVSAPVQAEGVGVVQKVRGAVSSLIWRRETSSVPPLPVSPTPNPPAAGNEGTR